MKKALVVLLAIVMVFAFAATAMAADTQYEPYGDISGETQDIQSAIERLTILGALKGYNDEGTVYGPAQNITREEFATIGVRIAGLESSVDLYASLASAFTDVEEGRWSEGYINCANANGIMIGRGNGIFDPKADVTMQEVVTVLLRAVGYTDALPGAWPQDYSTKAVNVGLCDYVDYIGPKAATRGEVASMVNEALDLYMVKYVSNDVAQGISYAIGTADEDGFAYIKYKTNEGLGELPEGIIPPYESLLNYTFDAFALDDTWFADNWNYSEGNAWGVIDYEDWQLGLKYCPITASEMDLDDFEDLVDKYGYPYEFADVYGVSAGQDIGDLGGQIGDVTWRWNEDKEIYEMVYAWTTSTIERTNDSGKDGIKADVDFLGFEKGDLVLDAETYGETYKNAKGKVYYGKDYSDYTEEAWDIVDSVTEKKIEGAGVFNGAEYPMTIKASDKNVFYKLGEGFIEFADVAAGDVIYRYGDISYERRGMQLAQKRSAFDSEVILYIVISPEKGALDEMSKEFVTLDDFDYDVQGEDPAFSVYGYDGAYNPYVLKDVLDIDWPEKVTYAVAYAFNCFDYFADEAAASGIGIVTRYQYGSGWYLDEQYNNEPLTAVEVLFAGETKPTIVKFSKDFYENQPYEDGAVVEEEWPEEGSLVEFKLNEDNELVGWKYDDEEALMGSGFNGDEAGDYYPVDSYVEPVAAYGYDDEETDVEISWNKAGTKVTFAEATEDAEAGDVFTFAADADVFVVTTFGKPTEANKLNEYAWMTAKDFQATYGDCTAAFAVVYAADGRQIQTLYVKDIADGSAEGYGFGLYEGRATDKGAIIDGVKVPLKANAAEAIEAFVAQETPCLVAYHMTDGEIDDVVFITDEDAAKEDLVLAALEDLGYEEGDYAFIFGAIEAVTDADLALDTEDTVYTSDINEAYVNGYDGIEDALIEDITDYDFDDEYVGANVVVFRNADDEHDVVYIVITAGE